MEWCSPTRIAWRRIVLILALGLIALGCEQEAATANPFAAGAGPSAIDAAQARPGHDPILPAAKPKLVAPKHRAGLSGSGNQGLVGIDDVRNGGGIAALSDGEGYLMVSVEAFAGGSGRLARISPSPSPACGGTVSVRDCWRVGASGRGLADASPGGSAPHEGMAGSR